MKNPLSKKKSPKRHVNRASNVKVNKYISPRKTRRSEVKNKRQSAKRKRLVGKLLVGSIAVVFVVYFFWNNSRVTEVLLTTEQQNYQSTVEQYLSRNPLASFKPFVSTEAITTELLSRYPEIENVVYKMPFFGGVLELDVTERQAQIVLQTSEDEYFIVDRNGYAYDSYDPAKGNENIVILKDDTDVAYDLDENRFVPATIVSFVEETDGLLKGLVQYKNQSFDYRLTDEARVIYVKPSGVRYEVKMQLDRPVAGQISSLSSALGFYKAKGINPTTYVDVRVNGTVYYK